jgi:ribosomal protein S18 acetylase RimI-like enzyme
MSEPTAKISYRIATPADDLTIAEHFYQLWLDNAVTPSGLHPDWQQRTLSFIHQARNELAYRAFMAETADGQIIGSAGCQYFAGLYPLVFAPQQRLDGYIWNVYVVPDYRRQGIGRALTSCCVEYLREIGCTRAVLNASPSGRPVYESLGFAVGNLMMLGL